MAVTSHLDRIKGQPQAMAALRAAVTQPVHAYMFVGPRGSGKQAAAVAFAAELLHDERPFTQAHPDVVLVEREGASIAVDQAREISRLAARSPLEGDRKVLILDEFHLVGSAAPALLKTIEEASASTVFVVLAESVPPELVTVASRCVRVDFVALAPSVIAEILESEGVETERAEQAAQDAMGDLGRARMLANDDAAGERRTLWLSVLERLDGTGATRTELGDAITEAIDAAIARVSQRDDDELAALRAQVKEGLATPATLKEHEAAFKRATRRIRSEELRAGFALLSNELARRLQLAPDARLTESVTVGLDALNWANRSLVYNPNEALLLQGLLARLDDVNVRTTTRHAGGRR